jgi:hypothetical protein
LTFTGSVRVSCVLEDVVEQAHRDAGRVHPHLRQDVRDLQGMHEVRLPGGAGLPLVLHRREHVGFAEQLEIRRGMVAAYRLVDVFETDHLSSRLQFREGVKYRQGGRGFLDSGFHAGL